MTATIARTRAIGFAPVAACSVVLALAAAVPAEAGSSGGAGFAQRSRMSSGLLEPRGRTFSRSNASASKSTFLRDNVSKNGSHFKQGARSNATSKFLTEQRRGDSAFRTSTRANTTSSFSKARGTSGEAAFSGTTSQMPRAKFDPKDARDPSFAKRTSSQPQSEFLDGAGRSDRTFSAEPSSKPTDGFPRALGDGHESAFADKLITNGKSSFPENKARVTPSVRPGIDSTERASSVRFSTGQRRAGSSAASPRGAVAAAPLARHHVFGRALVREGWARLGEGDHVDRLPDAAAGAIPIVSGGATYYRCDGIYLREVRDDEGNTRYVVTERID